MTERHSSALAHSGDDHGKSILAEPQAGLVEVGPEPAGSEARLIHYDLAGRYSLKALASETHAIDLADSLPPPIVAGGSDPLSNGINDA